MIEANRNARCALINFIKTFIKWSARSAYLMKTKFFLLVGILLICAAGAFAQGGKAEPNRVKFAKGKTSAVTTGTIKVSEEAEYIFAAGKGQKVTLKVVTTKPKGALAKFKLRGESVDFSTEYDTYKEYTFIAPETGDYFFAVMFDPAGNYRSAVYALTLSIK